MTSKPSQAPVSTRDLEHSERRFVAAMRELGFGRFECLRIVNGVLALDPWPKTVQDVKFSSDGPVMSRTLPDEFHLKRQVVEFLEFVRAADHGEIRCLTIRHGLPFAMEVILDDSVEGGGDRA